LILMPIQIVFLELIIDPACSVVFEAEKEEPGIMQQPPRKPADHILDRSTVSIALAQGFVVFGIVLALYLYGMMQGLGEDKIRTISFVTIVVANIALICTNRSWSESIIATFRKPNKAFWGVIGGTIFFLIAAITIPALIQLFQFATLSPAEFMLCLIGGIVSVVWFELFKVIRAPKNHPASAGW
ncbi:MAG: cation transporting ATPase C-terminal domain-containing protein, partial [Methanoregulaceae archaeon]|nr:cation transporting ATPase C-terminal domain-containing protein [Methanoregulaceae archaeon]